MKQTPIDQFTTVQAPGSASGSTNDPESNAPASRGSNIGSSSAVPNEDRPSRLQLNRVAPKKTWSPSGSPATGPPTRDKLKNITAKQSLKLAKVYYGEICAENMDKLRDVAKTDPELHAVCAVRSDKQLLDHLRRAKATKNKHTSNKLGKRKRKQIIKNIDSDDSGSTPTPRTPAHLTKRDEFLDEVDRDSVVDEVNSAEINSVSDFEEIVRPITQSKVQRRGQLYERKLNEQKYAKIIREQEQRKLEENQLASVLRMAQLNMLNSLMQNKPSDTEQRMIRLEEQMKELKSIIEKKMLL